MSGVILRYFTLYDVTFTQLYTTLRYVYTILHYFPLVFEYIISYGRAHLKVVGWLAKA